jgi:cytochrome c biogenesis protein CcdA
MPLVQAAQHKRDRLKMVAVLMASMVLVTALFGALVGTPASLLAGVVGSRRTLSLIMQPVLLISGVMMLVIALGEFGLIPRLLPEARPAVKPAAENAAPSTGGQYRRGAIVGVSAAATFGIWCTMPLYLALLVYIALIGSMAYGALAMAAYGVGLASSIALGGLVLSPTGRLGRLTGWLVDKQQAFHLFQGVLFAFSGAIAVAFFWLRYTIPPA